MPPDSTDVCELNNRVAKWIAQGKLDKAESTLAVVRRTLDARPPLETTPNDLGPLRDTYFFNCHACHVAWLRERYAEGLPAAQRAYELEKWIAAHGRPAQSSPRSENIHSFGSWAYVSLLTRCGRFDDAARIFDEILVDDFSARIQRDSAAAERILLAGLCIFFEAGGDAWIERARPVLPRVQLLAPAPHDPQLAYAVACLHARHGDLTASLSALQLALNLGVDPDHAASDSDLSALRDDPRFQRTLVIVPDDAVGQSSWDIASTPAGAHVWINGAQTGFVTPVRLRPRKPGHYLIKVTLDGHLDAQHEHHQRGDRDGLSLGLGLQSLEEIEAWRRADEDAARPADDVAKGKTGQFLGPEGKWASAVMRATRHTTYGLGSLEIEIRGDGAGSVRHETFAASRDVHTANVDVGRDVARQLLRSFIDAAFTEMQVANRPGMPDELFFQLELRAPNGELCKHGKFASNRHARFEALLAELHAAVVARLDAKTRKRLTLG